MPELTEQNKFNIRKLWSQLPSFSQDIELELNIRISPTDILMALAESTGQEFQEFANRSWSKEEVIAAIENTQMVKEIPLILETVELEETIIPDDIIRNVNEEQVKFKGEKWVIHKNDSDPFPSNPHAHNYEAGLKLHLGNGDLYSGTQLAGKITKKNLMKVRGLFKRTKIPKYDA